MLSLSWKSYQAVNVGEIVFYILQPAGYILYILKTSLSFVGSGLTFHCFVGCKEMSGAKEWWDYHPMSNAEIHPDFLPIPSKAFCWTAVASQAKTRVGCLPRERELLWELSFKVMVELLYLVGESLWCCMSSAKVYSMPRKGSHPWMFTYLWPSEGHPSMTSEPIGWTHHVVRDSGSCCSSSWWVWLGPKVTDLLSADCAWDTCPCQSFLKLHHTWTQTGTIEILIWTTVISWTCNHSPVYSCFWVGSPDSQERALSFRVQVSCEEVSQ